MAKREYCCGSTTQLNGAGGVDVGRGGVQESGPLARQSFEFLYSFYRTTNMTYLDNLATIYHGGIVFTGLKGSLRHKI